MVDEDGCFVDVLCCLICELKLKKCCFCGVSILVGVVVFE